VLILGGYLGAGKTTLIVALAERLRRRGRRAAVITNDQAPGLVDSGTASAAGFPVAEVAGGCFCCRFSDLVVAADRLLAHAPDVLLCEPVGSCTDVVATVVRPLQEFYGELLSVAPFAVVVDPAASLRPMPDELRYIVEKQLDEAALVLLNKADLGPPTMPARAAGKPAWVISALRGDGLDELLDGLLLGHENGSSGLAEIDYEKYGRGEALLAWLNAEAALPDDARAEVAEAIASALAVRLAAPDLDVAHVKVAARSTRGTVRAHLVGGNREPHVVREPPPERPDTGRGVLRINARVVGDPGRLRRLVEEAVGEAAPGVFWTHIESFRPAAPVPERGRLL
jgi:hypothetical protein